MLSFDSERKKFFALIAGVIATGGYVGWMFQRAWIAGPIDNPVLLFLQGFGISQYDVAAAVAGAFLGLSILMLFDRMKRGQGIILLAGIGTIMFVFVATGTLVSEWGSVSYVVLGIFFTLTFFPFGGLRALTEGADQFPRANILIVEASLVLVLIIFVEAHLHADVISGMVQSGGPTGDLLNRLFNEAVYDKLLIVPDMVLSGSFVYLLYLFVGYKDGRSLATVGPSRAGKTHFLVGLYHLVDNRIGTVNEDKTLLKYHSDLLATGRWLPATDETGELWFEYIRGWLHKKKRTISLHDYPGELFPFLPDAMRNEHDANAAEKAIYEKIKDLEMDVKELSEEVAEGAAAASSEEEDPAKGVANRFASDLVTSNFATDVNNADTVIFILDLETFRNKVGSTEDWGLDEEDKDPWELKDDTESTEEETTSNDLHLNAYLTVQSELDDDTQTIVVGTKSQVYAEEFVGLTPRQSYPQFRRLVTNKVKRHENVKKLLNKSDNRNNEIIPVYIEGDKDGPDTGPSGQVGLSTVGFDKVLEEIN